jgi:hypothetical protein
VALHGCEAAHLQLSKHGLVACRSTHREINHSLKLPHPSTTHPSLAMPEPLSIATGVISIVFNCIKGLEVAKIYVDKYSKADLKLLSLSTSCEALHEALRQITDLISSQSLQAILKNENAGGLESLERFEKVFGSCSIVFGILNDRVKPFLSPTFHADNTVAKRSRVAAVWNDSIIETLIGSVRDLTPAVQLLFSAFTAYVSPLPLYVRSKSNQEYRKSIFETHRILTSQDAARLFNRVDSDTQSLYTVHREQSITQGGPGREESILGDEEFPVLDDVLVNSKVYRRVLQSSLKRAADGHPSTSPRQSADEAVSLSDRNAIGTASLNSVGSDAEESSSATRQKRHSRQTAQRSFLSSMFRSKRPHQSPDMPEPSPSISDRDAVISMPSSNATASAQPSSRSDPWDDVRSLVAGAQTASAADFPAEADSIDARMYKWIGGEALIN